MKPQRPGVLLLAGLLVLALADCSRREEPKIDANLFPTDYKAEIVKFMPKIVDDPQGIRNAAITDPAPMDESAGGRYFVCVRFTPKRSATEYGNPEERIAIFFGGKLNQFIAAPREKCGNAAYRPFPELERICVTDKC
jgi:hypothetical protein